MNRVLIVGPFPKPISGLSLANQVLYNGLIKKHEVGFIDMSYSRFEENVGKFTIIKLFYFLNLNLKVLKVLKYESIYITIGQTFWGILKYTLFFLLGKFLNKKITIHLHGNQLGDMYAELSPLKKRIVKTILSMSDQGIVLSKSLKCNLIPFLPKKNIHIVSNFVEENLTLNKKEVQKKYYKTLRVIYIGNLMTEKGIFYLLDSLNNLKSKGISYKAKFAGDIDEEIKHKVYHYFQENDDLEYLGVLKGKEKKSLLIWGNVFVFPSYLVEGLPISILEAIKTKNMIISTRHPAILDFFGESSIKYIRKKSSDSISEALNFVNDNIIDFNFEENIKTIKSLTETSFVSKISDIII